MGPMTNGPVTYKLDWNLDVEDWEYLNAIPDVNEELLFLARDSGTETLDPREVLKVENQLRMGSCRGHSGSTGVEWLRTLATGKIGYQLSRMMMYIETQRLDGLTGDSGSSIANGIRLMETVGICKEELWPYPASYTQRRPANWQAVLDDAKENRIGRKERLRGYEQVKAWAGTGQGYIDIGIPWRSEYSAPVVEKYLGGRIQGYHAVSLFTLSDRTDSKGRPYVYMLNSHGLTSGQKGWSEYSPDFIDGVFQDRNTVMIGVSDMPFLKQREFTLDDVKKLVKWWEK
jgi:hypothetical protein